MTQTQHEKALKAEYVGRIASVWISEFNCRFNQNDQSDQLWAETAESEAPYRWNDFNNDLEIAVNDQLGHVWK